jgi:hypothetical protein
VDRITNVATGVSGITWSAPAMTMAQSTGEMAFSVFDEFEFHVYKLTQEEASERAERVAITTPGIGRNLPPAQPRTPSRVAFYLSDYDTGLEPPGAFQVADAEEYQSSLQLDFIGQPTIGVAADNFGSYIGGGASAYFSDMLGDRFMGVALSAQGTMKDIGGQVFYLNQKRRWNWGYAVGRIPYQYQFWGIGQTELNGQTYLSQDITRYRIFLDSATGLLAYPFSMTRRIEATLGFTRYSFDVEVDRLVFDQLGRVIDQRREHLPELEPDPLNMFQASVALVGDNSFAAFTSPVRGGRYRFEVEATRGTVDFQTITADYRRYFSPNLNLTFAVRGLHFGRYGYGDELNTNQFLQPLFLGYETLIRGYSWESLENQECGAGAEDGSCPVFERLFGHRIAVANMEVRIPFLGTEQFGLINLPYIPMELVAFTDVGLAWDPQNPVDSYDFIRSSSQRVPLWSSGVSARFNLLGFMIFEAYYAYPWQRPEKGAHWGFSLAPGW